MESDLTAPEVEVKRRGRPRRPGTDERAVILAEWVKSGRTVEEMARATGWSPWTLYRWRAKARGVGRPRRGRSTAALVAVPAPVGTTAWPAEIVTVGGVRLRLTTACTPEWVVQLVRGLERC